MEDIYDVLEELSNISNAIESCEVKERINNVIEALTSFQADIFNDLNSIDVYSSNEDEVDAALDDLMEKVDCSSYLNRCCNVTSMRNKR